MNDMKDSFVRESNSSISNKIRNNVSNEIRNIFDELEIIFLIIEAFSNLLEDCLVGIGIKKILLYIKFFLF